MAERQSYLANISAADASLRVFEVSDAKRRLERHACLLFAVGNGGTLLSKTDESQATLTGHGKSVTSVAFSPDGKQIVSASGDRTVRVWDAESREPLRTLVGHDESVQSGCRQPGRRPDRLRIVGRDGESLGRVLRRSRGDAGRPRSPGQFDRLHAGGKPHRHGLRRQDRPGLGRDDG